MRKSLFFIKQLLLLDILKGYSITLKNMFRKKITISYPEQKREISARFKGQLALRCYDNNEERCIGCKLCETICPAQAIVIETKECKNEIQHRQNVNSGARRATRFDIDLSKCIYCGLCEQACPTEAIVLTNNYEYCAENLLDLYYNKEKLLKNGKKAEPFIKQKLNQDAKFK